jgi:TPR repeat protein
MREISGIFPALAGACAALLAALALTAGAAAQGGGVTPDFVKQLEAQSKTGDLAATHALGLLYFYGDGVKQDYKKSASLFATSAEGNYPPAQSFLGYLYENGFGVPQDIPKAVGLYELAAAQGEPLAELSLGAIYLLGTRLPPDYDKAFSWLGKATADGDYQAALLLAQMHADGKGTKQDPGKAVDILKKASENPEDDGTADFMAGEAYREGKGKLRPNQREALRYYRKGAAKGHAGCQQKVAELVKGGK